MRKNTFRNTQGCGKMSAVASALNDTISDVIRREYRAIRHGTKILAQHARTSARTAERWITGETVPSGDHLLNLLAECDVLSEEVNRLVEERRAGRK